MIEIQNLSFTYPNQKDHVFHNLNMTVADGAYISIMGDNGCGKSTLVRLILGFLKPDSGSIKVGTKDSLCVAKK